jgi:hypothetical protein
VAKGLDLLISASWALLVCDLALDGGQQTGTRGGLEPDNEGAQLIAEAVGQGIPVIIVTSTADVHQVRAYLRTEGVVDLFLKTRFIREEFHSAVLRAVGPAPADDGAALQYFRDRIRVLEDECRQDACAVGWCSALLVAIETARKDPSLACVKVRSVLEDLLSRVYAHAKGTSAKSSDRLVDMLSGLGTLPITMPRELDGLMHHIRLAGNRGAHLSSVEFFDLGLSLLAAERAIRWYAECVRSGPVEHDLLPAAEPGGGVA